MSNKEAVPPLLSNEAVNRRIGELTGHIRVLETRHQVLSACSHEDPREQDEILLYLEALVDLLDWEHDELLALLSARKAGEDVTLKVHNWRTLHDKVLWAWSGYLTQLDFDLNNLSELVNLYPIARERTSLENSLALGGGRRRGSPRAAAMKKIRQKALAMARKRKAAATQTTQPQPTTAAPAASETPTQSTTAPEKKKSTLTPV